MNYKYHRGNNEDNGFLSSIFAGVDWGIVDQYSNPVKRLSLRIIGSVDNNPSGKNGQAVIGLLDRSLDIDEVLEHRAKMSECNSYAKCLSVCARKSHPPALSFTCQQCPKFKQIRGEKNGQS